MGKLTDDDMTQINGKYEILVGKLQSRYGTAKEQIEKELANFAKSCGCDSKAASSGKGFKREE